MNYKVLYRKYRPDDFENIVDQSYTIEILKNAILTNKISHAYIFAGPRGTGKTTTAKVFAKSINCSDFSAKGPCGVCTNCKEFNSIPDIIEIDAASNNGVDEIRELINSVKLAPTNSRYKVYIIDEVHMLSQSAFNALLLTLEEPPKHVVFILATTNIESVPVTILSRCQRFDFKKISDAEIINRMRYICKQENIEIEEEALEEIAYLADGGMRDALSILDQLSAVNSKITLEGVITHFGSISMTKVVDLLESVDNSDNNSIIKIISEFRKSSVDYKNLIKKILDVLYKKAIDAKENKEYVGLEYAKIKNLSFDLVDCLNKINIIVDPFMLIELTLLNYTNSSNVKTNFEEKAEINQSKSDIVPEASNRVESENAAEEDKFKRIRINNCFVNAQKSHLSQVKDLWDGFLNGLKGDKKLFTVLVDAIPVAASDKYIILSTPFGETANLLNATIDEVESVFNKDNNTEYLFVAVSELEWQDERKKYINNLKDNIKYHLLPEVEKNKIEDDNNNMEQIATSIFNQDKIEIN